ncbi:hypothetical protein [Pectinatus frisingensis]|nr:hypothetical protein [Pectinatus frisingensis]
MARIFWIGNKPLSGCIACQMTLGKNVFINHSCTCMSAGGITIDDHV